MRETDWNRAEEITQTDLATLKEKERTYQGSWKKRGGVGAFMMLARKWDRLEAMVRGEFGYDLFEAIEQTQSNGESLLETIRDLRCYLILVEEHVTSADFLADQLKKTL